MPYSVRAILFISIGVVALAVVVQELTSMCGTGQRLTVRSASYCVEIADRPEQWAQGLSHRSYLAPRHGMLFVFPEEGERIFWMKRMRFPLDFVWIRQGRVVGFETNVQPDEGSRRLYSPSVDAVLELNAGEVERAGIIVGDEARRKFCGNGFYSEA